jgi:hypothetical protein
MLDGSNTFSVPGHHFDEVTMAAAIGTGLSAGLPSSRFQFKTVSAHQNEQPAKNEKGNAPMSDHDGHL